MGFPVGPAFAGGWTGVEPTQRDSAVPSELVRLRPIIGTSTGKRKRHFPTGRKAPHLPWRQGSQRLTYAAGRPFRHCKHDNRLIEK